LKANHLEPVTTQRQEPGKFLKSPQSAQTLLILSLHRIQFVIVAFPTFTLESLKPF